jgi:hypothetical protein
LRLPRYPKKGIPFEKTIEFRVQANHRVRNKKCSCYLPAGIEDYCTLWVKTEKTIKMKTLSRNILLVAIIIFLTSGWSVKETWLPLRWTNKSKSDAGGGMVLKVEEIMEIFQRAQPLNPPRGLGVHPRAMFLERLSLPGNMQGPEPVSLTMGFHIPAEMKAACAWINVWINDPISLLGDPVLVDGIGEIYMMPPLAGKKGSQTIFSRSAHPSGYKEEFPSGSQFPLWSIEQEPFLRSVVRPTFKLAQSTAITLFTSGNRPFWQPVSQERWIMAMIGKASNTLKEFQAGVDAAKKTEITSQQIEQMKNYLKKMRELHDEKKIIEDHNKLREEMMALVKYAESSNPADAEKYRAQLIDPLDKQLEMQLAAAPGQRAELQKYEDKLLQALVTREEIWTGADVAIKGGDWDKVESLGKEYELESLVELADAGRAIEKLQKELNGLTPAQRRAPAHGFELPPWHPFGPHKQVISMPFDAVRPSGLVDSKSEGARALVCLDPAFFTFVEKNAPIRLMAIEWRGSHEIRYGSSGRLLFDDMWNSVDWHALRAMVE